MFKKWGLGNANKTPFDGNENFNTIEATVGQDPVNPNTFNRVYGNLLENDEDIDTYLSSLNINKTTSSGVVKNVGDSFSLSPSDFIVRSIRGNTVYFFIAPRGMYIGNGKRYYFTDNILLAQRQLTEALRIDSITRDEKIEITTTTAEKLVIPFEDGMTIKPYDIVSYTVYDEEIQDDVEKYYYYDGPATTTLDTGDTPDQNENFVEITLDHRFYVCNLDKYFVYSGKDIKFNFEFRADNAVDIILYLNGTLGKEIIGTATIEGSEVTISKNFSSYVNSYFIDNLDNFHPEYFKLRDIFIISINDMTSAKDYEAGMTVYDGDIVCYDSKFYAYSGETTTLLTTPDEDPGFTEILPDPYVFGIKNDKLFVGFDILDVGFSEFSINLVNDEDPGTTKLVYDFEDHRDFVPLGQSFENTIFLNSQKSTTDTTDLTSVTNPFLDDTIDYSKIETKPAFISILNQDDGQNNNAVIGYTANRRVCDIVDDESGKPATDTFVVNKDIYIRTTYNEETQRWSYDSVAEAVKTASGITMIESYDRLVQQFPGGTLASSKQVYLTEDTNILYSRIATNERQVGEDFEYDFYWVPIENPLVQPFKKEDVHEYSGIYYIKWTDFITHYPSLNLNPDGSNFMLFGIKDPEETQTSEPEPEPSSGDEPNSGDEPSSGDEPDPNPDPEPEPEPDPEPTPEPEPERDEKYIPSRMEYINLTPEDPDAEETWCVRLINYDAEHLFSGKITCVALKGGEQYAAQFTVLQAGTAEGKNEIYYTGSLFKYKIKDALIALTNKINVFVNGRIKNESVVKAKGLIQEDISENDVVLDNAVSRLSGEYYLLDETTGYSYIVTINETTATVTAERDGNTKATLLADHTYSIFEKNIFDYYIDNNRNTIIFFYDLNPGDVVRVEDRVSVVSTYKASASGGMFPAQPTFGMDFYLNRTIEESDIDYNDDSDFDDTYVEGWYKWNGHSWMRLS